MEQNKIVPVIDLFAGPGGLGEGFTLFRDPSGSTRFNIKLSIEKDVVAHQTLLLRTFLREFPNSYFPDDYYAFLRDIESPSHKRVDKLFSNHPREIEAAKQKALRAELGKTRTNEIRQHINNALHNTNEFVLIGGPPCQAYSLAGRSRNHGKIGYKAENDPRQYLYIEYLQVIADHAPAIFVMENVKGLLSATLNNELIFDRILDDLQNPVKALAREHRSSRGRLAKTSAPRYEIVSFVAPLPNKPRSSRDFIVRMEKFGIPQTRHRLILLGIRTDLGPVVPNRLKHVGQIPINKVLKGLPKLRSGLSEQIDSGDQWVHALKQARKFSWFKASRNVGNGEVYEKLEELTRRISDPRADRGHEFIDYPTKIGYRPDWYLDKRIGGVCNHTSRSHMTGDLYRYLYASCFAAVYWKSPVMHDFPVDLLPDHKSAEAALHGRGSFEDRFRVQIGAHPATTITSHISKDGHYYIHPDRYQCRSLTVREAARIQTFPDNYFFYGGRTAQYAQVGNAVPPLLALQLAQVVFSVLHEVGIT